MVSISYILITIVFLLAVPAYAGDYTLSTTAEQDRALAHRTRSTDTLVVTEFLQKELDALISSYDQIRVEQQRSQLGQGYDAATPEQRQQIDAILNPTPLRHK